MYNQKLNFVFNCKQNCYIIDATVSYRVKSKVSYIIDSAVSNKGKKIDYLSIDKDYGFLHNQEQDLLFYQKEILGLRGEFWVYLK